MARPRRRLPFSLSPFLPLTLSLLLAACDNTFEPINQEPTEFFGLFGFLDTAADTQFVRVSPVRETLEPMPETLTARALTTNLETGEQVIWQDSLVVLDDGQPGLLFYAQIPVEPGDAFRLEVQGDDGEVTRAVTQVPPPVVLDPQPISEDINQRIVQRVMFQGQGNIPFRLRVRYEVTPPGAEEPSAFTFPLFGAGVTAPGGLQIILPLESDRDEILRRLGFQPTSTVVALNSINLEIEQLSDEWENQEMPINIENGFGFFGAIARYSLSWTLAEEDLKQLGYTTPG